MVGAAVGEGTVGLVGAMGALVGAVVGAVVATVGAVVGIAVGAKDVGVDVGVADGEVGETVGVTVGAVVVGQPPHRAKHTLAEPKAQSISAARQKGGSVGPPGQKKHVPHVAGQACRVAEMLQFALVQMIPGS